MLQEATGSSSSQPPAGLPDLSGLFGALAGLGSNLIDFVSRKVSYILYIYMLNREFVLFVINLLFLF